MITLLRKFFWVLFLVEAVSGCKIKRFELDKDYGCGTVDYDVFYASDFPSEFVGTDAFTLGFWFKDNLLSNPSFTDWFVLFKMTTTNQNPDRQPAVYLRKADSGFYLSHNIKVSTESAAVPAWHPGSFGNWYFALETVNITESKVSLKILDPTQTNAASNQLSADFTGFSYNSSHKLYFDADNVTYTQPCISIWNPFMITKWIPTTNGHVLSLAFGIVPHPTYTFALQPYEVYGHLFDVSDDSSVLSTQNVPNLFWSTTKQSYPSLPTYSSSQASLTSFSWSHSFKNINGSLSFSMRFQIIIQALANDNCTIYWIVRRYYNQELKFGFGLIRSDTEASAHSVIIQIGSIQQIETTAGFVFNEWNQFSFGCYEQLLSQTVCIAFKTPGYGTPSYLVFPKPNGYVESTNDILLLGTGEPPWNSLSTQQCGYVSMFAFSMNQGAVPLPIEDCYDGCMIRTGGTNSKCYTQDSPLSNVACPAKSLFSFGRRDCVPCPLGCSTCSYSQGATHGITCSACSQNFTFNSTSRVCGCIGSDYFSIDPLTKHGKCVLKQSVPALITNVSQDDLILNVSVSPYNFYSSPSHFDTIVSFIKVYLQGTLLRSKTDYSITSEALDQFQVTLKPSVGISNNTIFLVDFSGYNQIEGVPTMITPSNASYAFSQPYYYVDPEVLQAASDLGGYTALGSYMQVTSASSFAIFSSGVSGAAVFILDAVGELEMYKYLNVKFPKNFFAFYESLYGGTLLPNIYSYMGSNDTTTTTSTYYKFGEWQDPVLFIDRHGDGFIKENVTFFLAILTLIPYLLFKKNKTVQAIHYTFRWNMLISFFVGDLTPFLVQIALQFREVPFITSDGYTIFSTSVSIIVLVSYVIIFAVGIYQINRKRLEVPEYLGIARRKLKERIEKDKFPLSMTVFIEEFKDESLFDKNFLLIAELEDIILSLNYALMQEMPLAQCYIYIFVTGFWLLLLLIGKPLKSRISLGIIVFNESVKLVLGIFAVVLATNDAHYFIGSDIMLIVGDVMIWTVVTTLGANTLFSIGGTLFSLYNIAKFFCSKSKQNRESQMRKEEPKARKHRILRNDSMSFGDQSISRENNLYQ